MDSIEAFGDGEEEFSKDGKFFGRMTKIFLG
jgi:hypothetical protein